MMIPKAGRLGSAEQRLTKEETRKLTLACDNGDGLLTKQEIKKALKVSGPSGLAI
ncbi:hypothetical protein SLEP1_g39239 [Rubroshorea leprosula]|uniref:EF-hand domain-containing protein n=1 Tax=Rubroshorea leprosula TaxID=152421 RepID=A0AAV5KZL5_9ROSI|nr:hypothetical protein SLEP1_g39239 [Rubroshorea leprosula]